MSQSRKQEEIYVKDTYLSSQDEDGNFSRDKFLNFDSVESKILFQIPEKPSIGVENVELCLYHVYGDGGLNQVNYDEFTLNIIEKEWALKQVTMGNFDKNSIGQEVSDKRMNTSAGMKCFDISVTNWTKIQQEGHGLIMQTKPSDDFHDRIFKSSDYTSDNDAELSTFRPHFRLQVNDEFSSALRSGDYHSPGSNNGGMSIGILSSIIIGSCLAVVIAVLLVIRRRNNMYDDSSSESEEEPDFVDKLGAAFGINSSDSDDISQRSTFTYDENNVEVGLEDYQYTNSYDTEASYR
jgi:hypothetical protein